MMTLEPFSWCPINVFPVISVYVFLVHYVNSGIVAQSNDTLDEIPQSEFVSTTTTGSQTSQAGSSLSSTNERDCGIRPLFQRRKRRVVGGRDAYFGEWPWQVSVRRTSRFEVSSTHKCGGAIINSQWIATAAHCVDNMMLTDIRIRAGEYNFDTDREPFPYVERAAKKKVVHPDFNSFTYENDLSLVQLDKPLEFQPHIGPICLPPDQIELEGKTATLTGWGRLSEEGIAPSVLQEVKVDIVSNDKCEEMFLKAGRHENISDVFICAGFSEGGKDSCQGDSGGPIQLQEDDSKWFLVGISSWGIGCGQPNHPGVNVRMTKFKNWTVSIVN